MGCECKDYADLSYFALYRASRSAQAINENSFLYAKFMI